MKTPEEIKKALTCPVCEQDFLLGCSCCSYHGRGKPPCLPEMHDNALTYIQQLEAERDALLKVACRYSGCYECKHYHNPSEQPPCIDCGVLGKNWEWRGALDKEG